MTIIQGNTTAANVIQQTPIKLKNSEQSDNVPAKQLIAKVQVLTTQIKEKQHDIEQESKRLQDILDTRDLDASDAKQITRIVHSLQRQVETLNEKLTEIRAVVGSSAHVYEHADDPKAEGPTMVVTFGYVGEAERALNELQVQLNRLQQLQRAINTAILDSQRGGDTKDTKGNVVHHIGTIAAVAAAANASANADAWSKTTEAITNGLQAALSFGSIALSAKNYKEFQAQTEAPDGATKRLENAKEFQEQLKTARPAQGAIGNVNGNNLPRLNPAENDRVRDLSEGSGPYRADPTPSGQKVVEYISAKEDLRARTMKNLRKEISDAELQKNTEATSYQTTMQTLNLWFDAGKQAISSLSSGAQAFVDGSKKGPAEATRSLSQYSNDQQSQAINAGAQAAQGIDQQALQLNQAKEKVNSQSQ